MITTLKLLLAIAVGLYAGYVGTSLLAGDGITAVQGLALTVGFMYLVYLLYSALSKDED